MIPKISSDELNNILSNAQGQLTNLDKRFEVAKKDISSKLTIIQHESEYVQQTLERVKAGSYEKIKGMIAFAHLDKATSGKYECFGSTVHAELIKAPINVFNLEVSALNEVYFREDVKIAINDKTDDSYLSILKHDIIQKPVFFEAFKENELTIKIEFTNPSLLLGPSRFNAIEIDPFLHGSFDISETRIYEYTENGAINDKALPIVLGKIPSVGIERIVLPNKINFYKIEFDIKLNYSTNSGSPTTTYPFGLKHIYFYNMDFKTDSFLIAEINSTSNIAYIKEDIILKTPLGDRASTVSLENIELFLDRDGSSNTLYTPIDASLPDEIIEIARNVKKIYARIPITPETNLIGVTFDVVNRTN